MVEPSGELNWIARYLRVDTCEADFCDDFEIGVAISVVIMVSGPIESKWRMTLSWIVRLYIHISAVLTACSSANVIGVWLRILPVICLCVILQLSMPKLSFRLLGN